jgi:hypothetical protein
MFSCFKCFTVNLQALKKCTILQKIVILQYKVMMQWNLH